MATYYWVGGNGTWDASSTTNWSASSGGAGGAGVPNDTDTVIFDSASGTGTCTTASGSACAIATLNSSTLGLTLGANHSMSGTFTLTLGTLSLGSNTLTCNIFSSSNSNTRSIAFGTGNITITGNNTTIWNVAIATGFSHTGTPTVNCTYSGSTGTRIANTGSSSGDTESNVVSFYVTAGSDIFAISAATGNRTLDFTGFTGTLTFNGATNIFGDLVISSGMTVSSLSNAIEFRATSGTQQITTNGKTLDFPITVNAPGATVRLQDNLTMGSTRTLTLTAGTIDLNNLTLSCRAFSSSNSNVRSIAFGTSGQITLTGDGVEIFAMGTMSNFSYTGTSNITSNYSGSTGTRGFSVGQAAGASETNALNFNITAGADNVNFGSLGRGIKNLIFSNFTGVFVDGREIYGNLVLSTGMTFLSNQDLSLSFLATSGTQQITTNGVTVTRPLIKNNAGTLQLQDNLTMGSTRTFTLTAGTIDLNNRTLSCGVFSSANSNTRSIAFGTASIDITGNNATVWSMTTATGFTYTGTPTVNFSYSGSTGARIIFSNVSGGITEANAVSFNITAGSDVVSVGTTTTMGVKNLNFTGFSGSLFSGSRTIYGNLTLSPTMVVDTSTSVTTFAATSGTQQITTNGKTLDFSVTVNAPGATVRLQDNLTMGSTRTFTHTAGTVDLNGKTLTVGTDYSTSGSSTRVIDFNSGSTLVCQGNFTATTGTNLSTTGTGVIRMASASAKTFAGGGRTYTTLDQGGAGTLTITGANTFANITNSNPTASQITFPASTITSVRRFGLAGSSGNLVSMRSSTSGTPYTIQKI